MSEIRKHRHPALFIPGLFLLLLSSVIVALAQEVPLPLPGGSVGSRAITITQTQTLVKTKHTFGESIRIDGDWMVTGSGDPLNYGFEGYVYQRDNSGVWSQQATLDVPNADFPYRVDLEGNTAVIGVTGDGYDERGSIFVYTRDSQNHWSAPQAVASGDLQDPVDLIFDLDPSGQRLALALNYGSLDYGEIKVFERNSTGTWIELVNQYIPVSPASDDIVIEGDTLYTTGYDQGKSFGVDIYQINANGTLTLLEPITANGLGALTSFGAAFEFEDNIGVIQGTVGTGSATEYRLYTYEKENGAWVLRSTNIFTGPQVITGFRVADQQMLVRRTANTHLPKNTYYQWTGDDFDSVGDIEDDSGYGLGDVDGNTIAVGNPAQYPDGGFPRPPKIDFYTISDSSIPTQTPIPASPTPVPPTETLVPPGDGLVVDGSFENGLARWTSKLAAGDKVRCNTATKVVAFDGLCALVFKGKTGDSSSVQQVLTNGVTSGQTLTLSGFVKAKGSQVKSSIKVTVSYTDASLPKDKIVVKVNGASGGSFVPLSSYQPTLSVLVTSAPAKVKLSIRNSAENSKVTYDALNLEVE